MRNFVFAILTEDIQKCFFLFDRLIDTYFFTAFFVCIFPNYLCIVLVKMDCKEKITFDELIEGLLELFKVKTEKG